MGTQSHPAKVDHQLEPSDALNRGDPLGEAFTGSLQAVSLSPEITNASADGVDAPEGPIATFKWSRE